MWESLVSWLQGLGAEYGVDPVTYAVIYLGAAPLFFGSTVWLVRSLRRRGPIGLPLLSTAIFFSAPTVYVFAAGRNLPAWVYILLVALAIIGAVIAARRVRNRARQAGP